MTLGCVRSRGLWVSLTVGMVGGVYVPWVCAESPVTAKVPAVGEPRQASPEGSTADAPLIAVRTTSGDADGGSAAMGPVQACCVVLDEPVCIEVDPAQCAQQGGVVLDNPTCLPGACAVGACCLDPGGCWDDGHAGTTFQFCSLLGPGVFFPAQLCVPDDPCELGPLGACCVVDDQCLDNGQNGTTSASCQDQGGEFFPNQLCVLDDPCDVGLGSCCIGEDQCADNDGIGMSYASCQGQGGEFFPGQLCILDDPCGLVVCEFEGPANCQAHNGNFILMTDSEVPGSWADDFRPQVSGIADEWCWQVCFYNPTDEVECFYDPPPDDFRMTIYADACGLPGIELMPYSPIAVIAKAPEDLQTNRCWQYSFHVPDAPFLTAQECYWVSLEGSGDPGGQGCTVYTQTSADGNSYVLHDIGGGWEVVTSIGLPPNPAVDLAFCTSLGVDSVNGGCGEFFGACCLPDNFCLEDAGVSECTMAGGLFQPGKGCAPNPCLLICPNDDCADAIDLNNPGDVGDCDAGLPCSVPFSNELCDETVIGTFSCHPPPGKPFPSAFGSDLWYKYTAGEGECGDLTLTMCPTEGGSADYDAMLALYVVGGGAGCPLDITMPDDCGDDTCGIGAGPASATVSILEAQDVYIRVGGWQGAQGTGTMVLTLDPIVCTEPEAAARLAPNVEHLLDPGLACESQADCIAVGSESVCIPDADDPSTGVCYVPGNVWLSTKANPNNGGIPTARRISLLTGDDPTNPNDRFVLGWIGAPEDAGPVPGEINPQYLAQVQGTPEYLDWSAATGDRPTHIGGCEVSPAHSYVIQAIFQGLNTEVEAFYSPPLTLHTVDCYGDVVGSGIGGNFPNGGVNLMDVFALVHVFQGDAQVPRWRADMEGNFVVSLSDVFGAVGSFQTGCVYPYSQPCNCQGQNCP